MRKDDCINANIVDSGGVTPEEIDGFRADSLEFLRRAGKKGQTLTIGDFAHAVYAHPDLGPRFAPHTRRLWAIAMEEYKKAHDMKMGDLPRLQVADRDRMPTYKHLKYIAESAGREGDADEIHAMFTAWVKKAKAAGTLSDIREGNVTPWGESLVRAQQVVAQQVSSGDLHLDDASLRKLGIRADDAIALYSQLLAQSATDVKNLRLAYAKAPVGSIDKERLGAEVLQANAFMDYVQMMLAGRATEVGRALNLLKTTEHALNGGNARLKHFIEVFGAPGAPEGPTVPRFETPAGKEEAKGLLAAARSAVQKIFGGATVGPGAPRTLFGPGSDVGTPKANRTLSAMTGTKVGSVKRSGATYEDAATSKTTIPQKPDPTTQGEKPFVAKNLVEARAELERQSVEVRDRYLADKQKLSEEFVRYQADVAKKMRERRKSSGGLQTGVDPSFFVDLIPDRDLAEALVRFGKSAIDLGIHDARLFIRHMREEAGINSTISSALWRHVSEPYMRAKKTGHAVEYGWIDARESPTSALALSLPDRAKALQSALSRDYRPHTEFRRDPHTIDMLAELGLYYHTMVWPRPTNLSEWAIHMQSGIGHYITDEDLLEAYQRMKPRAWSKVKEVRDFRQAAIRKVRTAVVPEEQLEALARIKAVDIESEDPILAYAKILREHSKARSGNPIVAIQDTLRVLMLSPDLSSFLNQGAIMALSDSVINPLNLLPRIISTNRPMQALSERLGYDWNAAATDARRRAQILHDATWASLASGYHVTNKIAQALGKIPKGVTPDQFYEATTLKIMEHEFYQQGYHEKFGLRFTGTEGASNVLLQEEIYRGNLIERWKDLEDKPDATPFEIRHTDARRRIGEIVSGSERAMSSYLNWVRAAHFERIGEQMIADGILPETHPEQWKAMASFVNDLTGSSDLPLVPKGFEGSWGRRAANFLFMAPRFLTSTWKMASYNPASAGISSLVDFLDRNKILPYETKHGRIRYESTAFGKVGTRATATPFYTMPRQVRREVYRYTERTLSQIGTIASLGLALGLIDEFQPDPTSVNFGKVRRGRTWYDLSGGRLAPIQMICSTLFGVRESATGKTTSTSYRGFKHLDKMQMWNKYFVGKLGPFGSAIGNQMMGEDFVGRPLYSLMDITDPDRYQGPYTPLDKMVNTMSQVANLQLMDFYEQERYAVENGDPAAFVNGIVNTVLQFFGNRQLFIPPGG